MKPLFAFSLLSFALVFPARGLTNKVLIIGIDGTMPSALTVARTPNLDALSSNGCYSVRVATHPVTHSAACWSSMFTGVWGDKHLVNDPNNSFAGNNFAAYPSFFKRLEEANPNWNTLCFARWSPLLTAVPEADVKLAFSTDAEITAEACRRLTNSNPDVFYMILLDVDSAGHSYGWGPSIPQYVSAIETADGRVGQIMAALKNRATYTNEDWLVIALTDHGQHDNPDPEKSRITWEIFSGPSAARGVIWPAPAIVDVCATVLRHMGVTINPVWNLDARVAGLPLAPTVYGTNLIFNGDAESNSGTDSYATNRAIAWWFDISGPTVGIYGANANFPGLGSPGPGDRGANFFLGGSGNGSISQRIDISDKSADVDQAQVNYTVAGWFGGAGKEEDTSALDTTFLDSAGAALGSVRIGNVSAAERNGITEMLERRATGLVPAGTRYVDFALTNHVVLGDNDASADNLSFVLTPVPDAPFPIEAWAPAVSGFEVWFNALSNRVYALERSEDMIDWQEVVSGLATNAGAFTLTDTNTAGLRAFYRVSCRRP